MAARARHEAHLANSAWEALLRAQATLAREFERDGDWDPVTPREFGVLHALSQAPGGLRITELGEDVLLTQAGGSRLVARLEKRGLVRRRDDPDDARACRIGLTEAGRDVQRRVSLAHARHVTAAMTRALSPAQLEALRDLSQALVAGVGPQTDTNTKDEV